MDQGKCFITGKDFNKTDLVPALKVPENLSNFIRQEHSGFAGSVSISRDALQEYRKKYLQKIIDTETKDFAKTEDAMKNALEAQENLASTLIGDQPLSFPQRMADRVAAFGGSWTFILSFCFVLVIWIVLNSVFLANKGFDPYPFILLNLILSCIAALQAPIIMMSQNRQEAKDRERNEYDYKVNLKAELEIRMLHEKLDHLMIDQMQKIMEFQQLQMDYLEDLAAKLDKKT